LRLIRRVDAVLRAVDDAIAAEEAHAFSVAVMTLGLGLYKYDPYAMALSNLDVSKLTTTDAANAQRLLKEHYDGLRDDANCNSGAGKK
jgi:hypothetical protein